MIDWSGIRQLAGLAAAFNAAPLRAFRRWLYTPPTASCGGDPGLPAPDPDDYDQIGEPGSCGGCGSSDLMEGRGAQHA